MTPRDRAEDGSFAHDEGMSRLLLPEEAAEILRVHPEWLYRAARRGQVPSVKLGRNVRFRPEDIRRLRDGGLASDA